jgi:hypothetical protein
MAKTWVLDTETKGTGAHIAPLPRADQRARERELDLVTFTRPASPSAPRAPAARPRFKVVDVLGARVLGEDVDLRSAVGLLAAMRSALDARVYARHGREERWRLLTLAEQRRLWELRDAPRSRELTS